MKRIRLGAEVFLFSAILIGIGTVPLRAAQEPTLDSVTSVEVTPSSLTLEVGETATLTATALDAEGNPVEAPIVFISRSRRNVGVTNQGEVEAFRPGEYTIVAMVPRNGDPDDRDDDNQSMRVEIEVTVPLPPLDRIEASGIRGTLYTRSLVRTRIAVYDTTDTIRPDAQLTYSISDSNVASVDRFGNVTPIAPGQATLNVRSEGVEAELSFSVVPNPAVSMELVPDQESGRTGDVIRFEARATDAQGRIVDDLPTFYSIQAHPEFENPAASASGQVAADGRFVAELPGQYTVVANAGGLFASATIEIERRDVQKNITVVGRAPVRDRHTSDLWVWEGIDGRDYAITGTWRAEGHAYVWDVTDPANMKMIDLVQVDARTVNDVKVSEDGTLAVISREGASNKEKWNRPAGCFQPE